MSICSQVTHLTHTIGNFQLRIRTPLPQFSLSLSNTSPPFTEPEKLSELYAVEARYESDLKTQIEQITALEASADSGDWEQFRQIVSQSGDIFLKPMRGSDQDPVLHRPLYESGELEERFRKSLKTLNKNWWQLMPWWARLGYRYQLFLNLASFTLVLAAIRAVMTGTPGLGAFLSGIAIVSLVLVDNSEPGLGRKSKWWVRLVRPKPRALLNKLRMATYVAAILLISWGALVGTFKTASEYCDDLSPADLAALSGCEEVRAAGD